MRPSINVQFRQNFCDQTSRRSRRPVCSRDTQETLNIWRQSRKFRTGKVTLTGFDFDKPQAAMQVERYAPGGYSRDGLEHYGYPGLYKQPERDDLGRSFARTQIEAMQAQDRRRAGEGENIEYLVVWARHHFQDASYASAQGAQGGVVYQGSYEFQPIDHPYKAPHVNAKPTINGPQTATVTGPAGEEIHTDRHGRIKVQFHWDRLGKRDDKSSRWVRVAQMNWSGGTWGGMAIPRIGMEVVVEFIEGDPDRPLVTGTVFNGANTVPYPLPQNKTRMTIKSKTYKGMGFNELRFEDEKGREEIFVHAQKDMNTVIENDETRVVREDRLTRISKNEIVQIGGDHSVYVKNTHVVSVGGDYHQYVGGSVNLPSVDMPFATSNLAHEKLKSSTSYYKALPDVSGNGNYQLTVKGNYHILTKKNYRMESHGTNVMSSGSETLIGSGKKLELHSVSNLHVIALGDMQIHSMSSILIKCGNASISMTKDGIVKIKGIKVLIN